MICIFSEDSDAFTDKVCAELSYAGIKFRRYDDTSGVQDFTYRHTSDGVNIEFNNQQPTVIWQRRGRFNIIPNISMTYLKKEADSIIKSTEIHLKKDIRYLGSFLKEVENYKLRQLDCAQECGLKIPDTLVTTSKVDLLAFIESYENCITKDIRYPANFTNGDIQYSSTGVKVVDKEMLALLDSNFAPILVQELIKKEYEIRLFFYNENIYPMAIFSQNNLKTNIDYRNYDEEKPNRCVPVKLPKHLTLKIKQFIKSYDIDTGSIDLIHTKNNEYYFLEVNPQGQLNWLSKNCNYYIEKDIAKFLSSER